MEESQISLKNVRKNILKILKNNENKTISQFDIYDNLCDIFNVNNKINTRSSNKKIKTFFNECLTYFQAHKDIVLSIKDNIFYFTFVPNNNIKKTKKIITENNKSCNDDDDKSDNDDDKSDNNDDKSDNNDDKSDNDDDKSDNNEDKSDNNEDKSDNNEDKSDKDDDDNDKDEDDNDKVDDENNIDDKDNIDNDNIENNNVENEKKIKFNIIDKLIKSDENDEFLESFEDENKNTISHYLVNDFKNLNLIKIMINKEIFNFFGKNNEEKIPLDCVNKKLYNELIIFYIEHITKNIINDKLRDISKQQHCLVMKNNKLEHDVNIDKFNIDGLCKQFNVLVEVIVCIFIFSLILLIILVKLLL